MPSKSTVQSRYVPDHSALKKVPLIPVDCSYGIVTEKSCGTMLLRDVVSHERQRYGHKDVMIVFAIRRPGCGSCRMNGQAIAEVAKKEKVGCVGIIKETNVDDDALLRMYQNYFHYPIYKDEAWRVYHAMGNRKIAKWKFLAYYPKLTARYRKNKVQNVPFGGDLFTLGGVLIFDKEGNLRFTYYERYGELIDSNKLQQAIQDAKNPLEIFPDATSNTSITN